MLLDGEVTGIDGDTKDLDLRHEAGPSAHEREGDQLGDNLYGGTWRMSTGAGEQWEAWGRTPVIVTEG